MTKLTDKQKKGINHLIEMGWTRKAISKTLGIPEGTISHYQNPKTREKRTSKMLHKQIEKLMDRNNVERKLICSFTEEEFAVRDNKIREQAYRTAAICTVNKLMCLSEMPIQKAIKQICDYQIYLINEYDLKADGKRRVK